VSSNEFLQGDKSDGDLTESSNGLSALLSYNKPRFFPITLISSQKKKAMWLVLVTIQVNA
jgi:hypothetical protein